MSTSQSNNLQHFKKTVLAISVAIIVFSSPCRAEELGIPENLSGDPVLIQPVSNSTKGISPLEHRMKEEEKIYGISYVLAPHRQNYFLVVNYNSDPNTEIYKNTGQDAPKNYEAKFQISFKVLTWKKMFGDYGDLFVAYTQRSVWQLYDAALSSPFRDTNFEPEVFVKFDTDFNLGGLKNRFITFGFNHQSNGESEALSRSWNRIYLGLGFQKDNWGLYIQPWYRLPEDSKYDDNDPDTPPSPKGDDNPDIEDYLGHYVVNGVVDWGRYVLTSSIRHNFRTGYGSIEAGMSFPLWGRLKGFIQFFDGYGESLIDYDHHVQRIGLGILLTDIL